MTNYKRVGAKWTVNECLRLQREYELLKLSIEEIADLHQRSSQAIMYKLDAEGIADYNVLAVCGTNHQLRRNNIINIDEACDVEDSENDNNDDDDSSSDYEEDSDNNDAASEVSDQEEEYDQFNMRQQVKILSEQVAYLSSFVSKFLAPKTGSDVLKFEDLAGCR
jgi:hypothetical protein